MKTDPISYLCVLALAIIWGSAFAMIEVALLEFSVGTIVFLRAMLAAFTVTAISFAMRQGLPKTTRHWGWCAVSSVFSLVLPFTLITWAQIQIDSAVTSVFIAATPLFILVLSRMILGTGISLRQWIGFGTGFVGLLWLSGLDSLFQIGAAGQVLPQLAVTAAALCYACGSIIVRKMPALPPVQATAASQICACVILAPFSFTGVEAITAFSIPLLALIVLGVLQTGLAQMLRYYAVKRAGPVFMSMTSYLIPVWAGLVGFVILSEPFTAQIVIGFTLIMSGLFIARARPDRVDQPMDRSNAG